MCYKFYIFWDGPHTHPARKKAGYEVATSTQARQGQRGTPRRPNPQVHEKRTREEGNQGDPKITTEPFHYHEHVQVGLKARGPAVFKLDSWQLSDWPRIDAHLNLTKNQKKGTNPERPYHLNGHILRMLLSVCWLEASTQGHNSRMNPSSAYQAAGHHRARGETEELEKHQYPSQVSITVEMHIWKGWQISRALWRLLRRITRLKFVNSTFGFTNHAIPWTGVARDRRPGPVAPCRTSTAGYTLG